MITIKTQSMLEAFKVGEYDYRREYNAKRWQNNYKFDAVDRGDVILQEMKNDRPTGMNALVMNSRKIFLVILVYDLL